MKKRLLYFLRRPLQIIVVAISKLPYFSFIRDTTDYQNRVTLEMWVKQKVLGIGENKSAYWSVHPTSQVYDVRKIIIGVDVAPGRMKGCYIQGMGGIAIGDYTQIAPNVGIISGNHDVYDLRKHKLSPVKIGKYCWLGMGAKIMPGVELGDFTVVGAGAVVTRSFPNGYCVLGGVPAKKIRDLDPSRCVKHEVNKKYRGFIKSEDFEKFRSERLLA